MTILSNTKDPYIQPLSIKFWFKLLMRKFAYIVPPSSLKNLLLNFSGIKIYEDVFVGVCLYFFNKSLKRNLCRN